MKNTELNRYNYFLPEELIAQTPSLKRDSSRLLVLDRVTGIYKDKNFYDIIDYLSSDDVLVINNTKVIPGRIFGIKSDTNAKIEVLLIKESNPDIWQCLVKPQKRLKIGTEIIFSKDFSGIVESLEEDGITNIKFEYYGIFLENLESIGIIPLPPYIHEKLEDNNRYQTVYAKNFGSAAAPTAGLHFTPELLNKIKDKGIEVIEITLNVGIGTFRPVNDQDITKHKMHSELYEISEYAAFRLNEAKTNKKRIVCVGTTSVRTLESNYNKYGRFTPVIEETDIFIYPPYKFKVVGALITNFHLPKSTLLMLISAFSVRKNILNAYKHAVDEKYRFFSFGDAMFITDLNINIRKIKNKFLKKNKSFIKKDGFKIFKGKSNVIISVPHAYKHIRKNILKTNEYNTVNLAKILYTLSSAHIIYQYRNNKKDNNYNISSSYKETLKNYIIENNIKYLLDIHGCDNDKLFNIEIGTNSLENINKDRVLLEDIITLVKKHMTRKISIDEYFKSSRKNTVSSYINRKTNIKSIQFEIKKNFRKLKRKPETFKKTVKCFVSIIKYLEESED